MSRKRQTKRGLPRRGEGRDRQHVQAASSSKWFSWWLVGGAIIALAVAAGLVVFAVQQRSNTNAQARATAVAEVQPVDGIQCSPGEQLVYHIHQHIVFYDHGRQVPLPSEIGIIGGEVNGSCYFWIHVHQAAPGFIHVESPVNRTFRLGAFFDVWERTAPFAQPPGDAFPRKVAAAAGHRDLAVFLNGHRWRTDYRAIPLVDHAVITVEIGRPIVPPKPVTDWSPVETAATTPTP
jgi:hypothetical protein